MAVTITDPATTDASHVVNESDYEQMYRESLAENDRLRDVLAATSVSRSNVPSLKPAVTAQRLTALVGRVELLNMTRDGKLQALGVDPSSVTDDKLYELFGRGNDGRAAQDLLKSNRSRYLLLREAALLLNAYGAKNPNKK